MAAFGTTTNLVAGTITLTPGSVLNNAIGSGPFWFIQNQDIAPLIVSFPEHPELGNIVLRAAASQGDAGGYIDSVNFPPVGSVKLDSTIATAQFSSGSTTKS